LHFRNVASIGYAPYHRSNGYVKRLCLMQRGFLSRCPERFTSQR